MDMESEAIDEECRGVRIFISRKQHWSDGEPFRDVRSLACHLQDRTEREKKLTRWLNHADYDADFHGPMPDATPVIQFAEHSDPAIALRVKEIHDALSAAESSSSPVKVKKEPKKHNHRKYVKKPRACKSVRSVETGVVYLSITIAATQLGVSPSAVNASVRKGCACKGNHFQWA